MKRILPIIFILVLLVSVCACGKKEKETKETESTSVEQTGSLQGYSENTAGGSAAKADKNTSTTKAKAQASKAASDSGNRKYTRPTTTTRPAYTTEKGHVPHSSAPIEKTGDMAFTTSAKNKYIKAVAEKYNVEKSNLAAIYTVPENDSNIVLQFDGSTNGNGKPIRTKDTLVAIYTIDKKLNSRRASQDLKLNEYDYGEMKVIFFTTTRHIMPEFEKELNG
jgi:flagellar capping protein FliD